MPVPRSPWGDLESGYRELRLLALSLPEEVEALATLMARSPTAPLARRLHCARLLGELAGLRRARARSALEDLAGESPPAVAQAALGALSASDFDGRYRPLYELRTVEGDLEAAALLSWFPDPHSSVTARLLDLGSRHSRSAVPSPGAAAAEYYRWATLLDKRPFLETVNRAFAGRDWESHSTECSWLIEYGRRHAPVELRAALRTRLDWGFAHFRGRGGSTEDYESGRDSPRATLHDEMLVVLWELGGGLHPRELRRLEYYGYACDPGKRLQELLQR